MMELRHIKNGLQEINVEDRTAEFVICLLYTSDAADE